MTVGRQRKPKQNTGPWLGRFLDEANIPYTSVEFRRTGERAGQFVAEIWGDTAPVNYGALFVERLSGVRVVDVGTARADWKPGAPVLGAQVFITVEGSEVIVLPPVQTVNLGFNPAAWTPGAMCFDVMMAVERSRTIIPPQGGLVAISQ